MAHYTNKEIKSMKKTSRAAWVLFIVTLLPYLYDLLFGKKGMSIPINVYFIGILVNIGALLVLVCNYFSLKKLKKVK